MVAKVPAQEAQGNMKIIEDGIAHKPATTVPSAGSEKAPLERQLVRAARASIERLFSLRLEDQFVAHGQRRT